MVTFLQGTYSSPMVFGQWGKQKEEDWTLSFGATRMAVLKEEHFPVAFLLSYMAWEYQGSGGPSACKHTDIPTENLPLSPSVLPGYLGKLLDCGWMC